MNEKLEKIIEKVYENNPGRLYTPEHIFAEYVEYYTGYDIEIEPEILRERMDDFFEEGSASLYEYPLHTLKLDNLTKEEYDYFYQELNDICNKIYDSTNDEWLKTRLKEWFEIK